MKTVLITAIIALVVFFIWNLYQYIRIEKEPKNDYVDIGKFNFDKDLNNPNDSEIDIDNWDTENVTSMLLGCKYLTNVSCLGDLDLANWDTSDITAMVTIKNTAYLDYCRENGLEVHRFNFAETGLITYAKETEHPKLFDGSLD